MTRLRDAIAVRRAQRRARRVLPDRHPDWHRACIDMMVHRHRAVNRPPRSPMTTTSPSMPPGTSSQGTVPHGSKTLASPSTSERNTRSGCTSATVKALTRTTPMPACDTRRDDANGRLGLALDDMYAEHPDARPTDVAVQRAAARLRDAQTPHR